jgi:hypothetical protein
VGKSRYRKGKGVGAGGGRVNGKREKDEKKEMMGGKKGVKKKTV